MFALNILGILVAAMVVMVLGAIWYSPILFGNKWMESIGKTPETSGKPTGPMIGNVIACLLTALGISLLFSLIGVENISTAAIVGLILGLLIIFPAMLSDNLFCGWGNTLLKIQVGYRATSAFLMSIVMYFV